MLSSSDEEQLAFAASHGRAIFTHNIRDYITLSSEYARQRRPHAGILYCSDHPIGVLRDWIAATVDAYPDLSNLTLGLPLAD